MCLRHGIFPSFIVASKPAFVGSSIAISRCAIHNRVVFPHIFWILGSLLLRGGKHSSRVSCIPCKKVVRGDTAFLAFTIRMVDKIVTCSPTPARRPASTSRRGKRKECQWSFDSFFFSLSIKEASIFSPW